MKSFALRFVAALVLVSLLLGGQGVHPAHAATFTINTTADTVDANPGNGVCADSSGNCSLRAAIMEANALAGADTVTLPAGIYSLTLPGSDNASAVGDLDITEALTLNGAGAASTTIQQSATGERVIHIVFNINVSLNGVFITGGSGVNPGGGIYNVGTLNLNNSAISTNTTTNNGGGIYNAGGSVTLNNVNITTNSATASGFGIGLGGGIYNDNGALVITNSDIRLNGAARRGGGIASAGSNATLSINNSVFVSNYASGNSSFDGGGGIHTNHSMIVQNSTFRTNRYTGDAHGGGAILATGGNLTINDSLFEANEAGGNGGGAIALALDLGSPSAQIARSTFRGNLTLGDFGDGGAINANGPLDVWESTFENNRANGNDSFGSGSGGGIIIINNPLYLENVTMSGNRANGDGGAVYYRADISALLTNVTIASNLADADGNATGSGGGIFSTGDGTGGAVELRLQNSILSGNTGGDCSGFITSTVGYNLIQNPGPLCVLGGVTTGNLIGSNPNLGPLANNGGPTQTRALLSGSPAIDAADPGASCAVTDQRGVARFDGNYDSVVRCDMGAYEFNQPAPPPATTSSLPKTGFPMGRATPLPPQPAEKAYASYSDLTLEIPSLGVNAPIVGVLKSDDSWDVSWLGNSVGWLEGSAFPTWQGNTVLTGHVWNADNTPGVFNQIKTLKYGDRFYIHAYGQTYVYEVRENVQLWGLSRVDKVFQHKELDWVTLLTCEGYNPLTGDYLFRRMVRAVLVEVK